MLTFESGVRNLEGVKDAHANVLCQIGNRARHANEPHFALSLQREQCVESAIIFERCA